MTASLANPYTQVIICSVFLLLIAVFSKLSVAKVISSGLYIGIAFLPVSLFYGVFFDHTWMYLFHLLLATAGFSALWVALFIIADKFGIAMSNGEGAIMMITPVTFFPAIFAFAVISKFIFDFIRTYI